MQLVLPATLRYYMHAGAVDLRKGFDGLCGVVQRDFNREPQSGDVFIFLNHHRNRIKLLHWQGDGFAVFYKRLERGTYEIPPKQSIGTKTDSHSNSIAVSAAQLQFILDGIVLTSVKKRVRFHRETVNKI